VDRDGWLQHSEVGSPAGSRRGGSGDRRGSVRRPGTPGRTSGGTWAASPAATPAAAPAPSSAPPYQTTGRGSMDRWTRKPVQRDGERGRERWRTGAMGGGGRILSSSGCRPPPTRGAPSPALRVRRPCLRFDSSGGRPTRQEQQSISNFISLRRRATAMGGLGPTCQTFTGRALFPRGPTRSVPYTGRRRRRDHCCCG
jgi:hypothetical protein